MVNLLGELETLLQICVLHQVHEYVGFWIVWVKAFVPGRIVILKFDHGVFPSYNIHVAGVEILVLAGVLPQNVDGISVRPVPSAFHGIYVD